MSELRYFIEQLKPIQELEWVNKEVDTLAWVRIVEAGDFPSIAEARAYVNDYYDNRLSYRVTDGGRVWRV